MVRIAQIVVVAAVASLVFVGSGEAALIQIDFSTLGLAEGQSFEGNTVDIATFTSENGTLTYTNSFGAGLRTSGGSSWDVYIDFAAPIDSISVRAGDGAGDNDAFALSLFEFGTNNFLGTFASPVFGGINEPEWFTLVVGGVGNIGRVVFDPGNAGVLPGTGQGLGGVIMTDLDFNTVEAPEPGTLSLTLLALMGLSLRRRRRGV